MSVPYMMADVLRSVASPPGVLPLEASPYTGRLSGGVGLAVSSMSSHMTDEGWQIFQGLQKAGYVLFGHGLSNPQTDVPEILTHPVFLPKEASSAPARGVVVVQDKREWDLCEGDFRDPKARFTGVGVLRHRPDLFKLTILKDAQQRPSYHRESAEEMGVHAWITYYHPDIVCHVAPYVRREHLVRTYHTIDPLLVPRYTADNRGGCLLSGAVSNAYPLRQRLFSAQSQLHQTMTLRHPGYHRMGAATPEYLKTLSKFKVAICTASVYGYALRKIIEATACGCRVITDLPADEVLPEIDMNLTRVRPDVSIPHVSALIKRLCQTYDPMLQEHMAKKAQIRYDYVHECCRLAQNIENMRGAYSC